MTILDLAELVIKLTGNPAGIELLPDRRGAEDPQRRRPDISRAKQHLDWSPSTALETGLQKTIEDFKKRL
jgi:nucleoside-diphosphate-sugar epimerase